MQTPAGKECPYFYADYYRGREHEECRLLKTTSYEWTPDLCFRCPVPEISRANACKNQVLEPKVERPFLVLNRRVSISAYCTKCQCSVKEPKIGCGQCHPLPFYLSGEDSESDSSP